MQPKRSLKKSEQFTVQGAQALEAINTLLQLALGLAAQNSDTPAHEHTPDELAVIASTAIGLCVCAAAKLGHQCSVDEAKLSELVNGYMRQALAALQGGAPIELTSKGGDA